MRKNRAWFAGLLVAGMLAGCHHRGNSHITGGVLGRVVIYRNGVAFYERNATVDDGKLMVSVPRERVDDFLKSLTVVDRKTGKPLGVTIPRNQNAEGTHLTMTLETPENRHAEVVLTYVTEAPSWKPSYRVVVGNGGKVMLEGWAVVDNTTSEDWKGVLVGVGASSALAFRYDLWSVHTVDRDLLQGEEKFAIAPPSGVSPYADNNGGGEELAALDGAEVRAAAPVLDTGPATSGAAAHSATTGGLQGVIKDKQTGEKVAGATVVATSPTLQGAQTVITDETGTYQIPNLPPGVYTVSVYYLEQTLQRGQVLVVNNKTAIANMVFDQSRGGSETIQITGAAPVVDQGSTSGGVTITDDYIKHTPVGRSFGAVLGSAAGSSGDVYGTSISGSTSNENVYVVEGLNTTDTGYGSVKSGRKIKQGNSKNKNKKGEFGEFIETDDDKPQKESKATPAPQPSVADEKLKGIVAKVRQDKRDVLIEVHGPAGSDRTAIARGNAVKNKLVDTGIPATKIHVVPKLGPNEPERVRVLAVASKQPTSAPPPKSRVSPGDTPVGESHFIADRPMTVRAGSSAMVAMVHSETTGGVVYLYDPISDRGDKRFAFKSVHLDNPTSDTLEPGPVTVYGDGRFIGEGITEPVPPHAVAVIPFALDKQVVVERTGTEEDQIAKLMTVQRGIISAEVQHRRDTKFAVTSRLTVPTTVYLRHRLQDGWSLLGHPEHFTKVGDSHLFQIEVRPGETKIVSISESTPVERTFSLASDEGLGMMKVYVNDPKADAKLKEQVKSMLAIYQGASDLVDKIETLRESLSEYRARSAELHAQVLSLKAVKTGGELMVTLKTKLAEMSERTQKATIAIVETQEKLMLARVKFQNQLAELRLTDVTKKETAAR